ncbi:hypothetical protein M5K25_025219 [Dendrobium thyrsiflorum]|uniref:Uncharacterized protein n=1 Tax=Dendrobium thyrsiflorum TaxID=117978 RepID=A0ABD0U3X4_DENTH
MVEKTFGFQELPKNRRGSLRKVPKLIFGIETFPSLTPSAPTSSSLGRHPSSLPLAHGHHSPPLPSPRPATHPLLAALPLHLSSPGKPCMGDPDVDHEFLYDEQGRVDILQSPFFDVTFGSDRTVDEYVDRIIYQLTLAIEDRIPQGRWYLIGRPSTPPNLAPNPATTTRGILLSTSVVSYTQSSLDLDPASEILVEKRIRKKRSPEPETECIHFVDANDITDDKGFFEDETEVTKLDSLYDLNPDLGVLEPLDLDTLVHLDPNDIKDIPLDKVCLDDINLISKEADLTLNPLKLSSEDSDFIISPNKTTPNNSGLILNNSDVNNLESEVSQLDLLHELDPNLIDPESFELRVITKHDPIENINMSSEDSNLNLKDSEPNFNNEPPLTLLDPNLGVAPLDLHLKESVLPDWADHITPPTDLNENISPHFHVVPTSTLDTLPRLLSPISTGDSLGYVIMFESDDPSSYHTPDSYILPTTSLSFPVKDLPSPSWLTLLNPLTTPRRLSVTLAETPYGDALLAKDVFIAPPTPVPLNRETFCPLILRLVPKLIFGIETFPSLTPSAPTSSSLGRHPSSLPLAHGHHSPPLPSPRPATHPLLAALPLHLSSPGKPCMGDPDVDHEFLYDEQGRVDILQSPFFDVTFGSDRTVDEYVDRIIYQLTLAIEDRIPQGRWYLIGRPSTPPNLAPNPATTTRGILLSTTNYLERYGKTNSLRRFETNQLETRINLAWT